MADRIVAETRYLRMIERDGWYFVERPNSKGVVTILPLTRERRLIFVEQLRAPLGRKVIEFPAGLMGDEAGHESEDPAGRRTPRARRGNRLCCADLELVATTATSPGMANEFVHFVLAWNLDRVGPGGGVDNENIVVHEVPMGEARAWLGEQERCGLIIAAKVFAGLYFANERWGS
jgi:ADP-ribose pyrophosphatase